MTRILAAIFATTLALPAFADGHATGDAEAGEKVFKKCKSCHMIESDAGETIMKGGKTGPNLWGIYQRAPGSVEGYKYGKDLASIAEIVPDGWNEAEFVEYVADPKAWVQAKTDNSKAKSKMSLKLKKAEDAANVWAYLVSVGPAPE